MYGDNGHDQEANENFGLDAVRQPNIASELIGQDDSIRKLFLTLSQFMDINEANDFAMCIHKCEKHKLETKKRLFLYMINARVSVKGNRAAQIVDVLTQIQRMEEENAVARREAKRDRGARTPNL